MSDDEEIHDVTGDIYNLTASYTCLGEIDEQMLPPDEREMLSEMKEKMFKALHYFCLMLPE